MTKPTHFPDGGGLPCFQGEGFVHNSGASRREIVDAYFRATSLRGAKRRTNPLSLLLWLWIASLRSQLRDIETIASHSQTRLPLASQRSNIPAEQPLNP